MMTRDISKDVRRVLSKQLEVDEARLAPTASFTEDLGADSLSLVELTLALEDEFDIDIDDEDAVKIRTVQDAIRFVEARAKAAGTVRSSAP
jgi:acyl carrier protein